MSANVCCWPLMSHCPPREAKVRFCTHRRHGHWHWQCHGTRYAAYKHVSTARARVCGPRSRHGAAVLEYERLPHLAFCQRDVQAASAGAPACPQEHELQQAHCASFREQTRAILWRLASSRPRTLAHRARLNIPAVPVRLTSQPRIVMLNPIRAAPSAPCDIIDRQATGTSFIAQLCAGDAGNWRRRQPQSRRGRRGRVRWVSARTGGGCQSLR